MPKILLRIVAFVLVPCLLADPALSMAIPRSFSSVAHPSLFSHEAFALRAAWITSERLNHTTPRLKVLLSAILLLAPMKFAAQETVLPPIPELRVLSDRTNSLDDRFTALDALRWHPTKNPQESISALATIVQNSDEAIDLRIKAAHALAPLLRSPALPREQIADLCQLRGPDRDIYLQSGIVIYGRLPIVYSTVVKQLANEMPPGFAQDIAGILVLDEEMYSRWNAVDRDLLTQDLVVLGVPLGPHRVSSSSPVMRTEKNITHILLYKIGLAIRTAHASNLDHVSNDAFANFFASWFEKLPSGSESLSYEQLEDLYRAAQQPMPVSQHPSWQMLFNPLLWLPAFFRRKYYSARALEVINKSLSELNKQTPHVILLAAMRPAPSERSTQMMPYLIVIHNFRTLKELQRAQRKLVDDLRVGGIYRVIKDPSEDPKWVALSDLRRMAINFRNLSPTSYDQGLVVRYASLALHHYKNAFLDSSRADTIPMFPPIPEWPPNPDVLKVTEAAKMVSIKAARRAMLNPSKTTTSFTEKGRLQQVYPSLFSELRHRHPLDRPLTVVDLGIGDEGAPTTFDLARALHAEGFQHIKVIGVDIEPANVKSARENISKQILPPNVTIEFVEGDFDLAALGLNEVDLVTTANVLRFYSNPSDAEYARALMQKVLKRDGLLAVIQGPDIVRNRENSKLDVQFRVELYDRDRKDISDGEILVTPYRPERSEFERHNVPFWKSQRIVQRAS